MANTAPDLDDLPFNLDTEFTKGGVVTHRSQRRWWGFEVKERWERVRDLGTGSFGVVWLEQEEGAGKLRAVKRMTLLELTSKNIDFRRELQTLVALRDHQSLFVQFLGWYKDDNFIYLAMEYVKYGDLEQYLNQYGPQEETNAKEITRQLLEGLVVLQKKKICHRDLKPQNVLVASTSPIHVKLADFGVSKCYEGTILDTRLGTSGYQAPELLGLLRGERNLGYTNAVDLWALGCLLHKILTMETPFSVKLGASDFTTADSSGICSGPPMPQIDMHLFYAYCSGTASLPTETLQSQVGGAGVDFIKRLLVPNPRGRLSALEALDHGWMNGCFPFAYEENSSRTLESQFISLGILPSPGQIDVLVSELRNSHYIDILPFLSPSNTSHAIFAAASKGYASIVEILLGGKSADFFRTDTANNSSGRTVLQVASNGGHLEVVTLLLDRGADINASSAVKGGRTALQAAAEVGHLDIVTLLLDRGADINASPAVKGSRTALQAAAEVGHLDIVKLLLDRGADINASPAVEDGRTALQAAAEVGHLDIVTLLLDKCANINAPPAHVCGRTALQAAAAGGHPEVMRLLLDRGADINAPPAIADGRIALQAAAEVGHLDIVTLLLDRGADTNFPPAVKGGRTALQVAARAGHLDIVALLLDRVADINASAYLHGGTLQAAAADVNGRTALHAAVEAGHLDIVTLLLDRGANINASPPYPFGRTVLQTAAEAGYLDIVTLLLDWDADINALPVVADGRTALQAAVEAGHLDIVTLLLDRDADINASPAYSYGRTVLQTATEAGHLDIVILLLDRGADINASPAYSYGRTALQAAAEAGHLDIATLLLDRGAHINAPPAVEGGRTALQAATKGGHSRVVELLLGRDTNTRPFTWLEGI